MQQIDWNNFGLKGESKQKSFEDLCLYLFSREKKTTKIDSYFNQPGIETEPISVNNKFYGIQVKYFDGSFSWPQIQKSIDLSLKYYNNINEIYIYTNKDKTKSVVENRINEKLKRRKIQIVYYTYKRIMIELSKPSNFDLAQLYFGIGDELGFIRDSFNPSIQTFIKSNEFISLPICDKHKNQIDDLHKNIIESKKKNFIIVGNPGSGKTILMHKLMSNFCELEKPRQDKLKKNGLKYNAIPIVINLRNCFNDSLTNIISTRKNDYDIKNKNLKFIYLFDGLDELNELNAEHLLLEIARLVDNDNTLKIILSCRRGSLNRYKADSLLRELQIFEIEDLQKDFLKKYFKNQKNKIKLRKLNELSKNNSSLVNDIKDILLYKIFYDTIDELNENSTIIDLFSKKIDMLFESSNHKKYLEELNLLDPKKEKVISINKILSYKLQKKFEFSFTLVFLQKLILNSYKGIDNISINKIVNYISDLFLDSQSSHNESELRLFQYQHRRYQEFFLVMALEKKYEENPLILRDLNIISNKEFFQDLFLKYLRKQYKTQNNLAGLIELTQLSVMGEIY